MYPGASEYPGTSEFDIDIESLVDYDEGSSTLGEEEAAYYSINSPEHLII